MVNINPVLNPVQDRKSDKWPDAQVSTPASGGYDSYRPDQYTGSAGQPWNTSRKRRRDGPDYRTNYFHPRAWTGGNNIDGYDLERDGGKSNRIGTKGWTDRGRGESSLQKDKMDRRARSRSTSRGMDGEREQKRSRLD